MPGLGGSKVDYGAIQIFELFGLPDKSESFAALLAGRQVPPLPEEILTLFDPTTNACENSILKLLLQTKKSPEAARRVQLFQVLLLEL